ncbi:restriction endonuclease subunit S [Methanobacterium sp. CWC-01]|uniref:restriction endonuclease subunit S n=1 Tax=Methanobacterium aridiramus TaxID=2584467 RepID=UPI002574AC2A|nr:restriction endonuclease subunit S [Methanobacterium sp. CWC-01]WJI08800.1 restriction endonuclease subunit S [Methanobacterium sp. CWC-01]
MIINLPKLRFPEFKREWEEIKLGEVSEKISDGIHATPKYKDGNDYFFVNGNNLVNKKIVFNENTKSVPKEEFEKYKKNLGEQTILISINGTIGNLAYYNYEKVILGKSAAYINLKSDIFKEFIYNYLQTHKIHNFFNGELTGTTIKNLSLATLKNTPLFLPDLKEQEKIASFLSKVDEKIDLLEKNQELWETYKKGMMQQIFSQKLRFKDENGEDYPDWEEKRLGEVAHFLDGRRIPLKSSDRAKRRGPYPYYGASGIIDYIDDYIFDEELVLLAEDGANIITRSSRLAFLAKGKYWVNNHAHVIKGLPEINQYFLCEQLERVNYAKYNTGTAQPKLNNKVCLKIPIKIPKIEEQEKIASILSKIDEKIEQLDKELEINREFKKGLLQQMFC